MKNRLRILTKIFLMTLLYASCSDTKTNNQDIFVFPDIVDTMKTADSYYSPKYLTNPINFIKTIQKLGDKANLIDTTNYYEYFIEDHRVSDPINKSIKNRKGLSIYVDTTREISVDIAEWGVPPLFFFGPPDDENHPKSKTEKLIDSVDNAVRFELWESNKKLVRGFPVYIFNPTNNAVRLKHQDGRVMMIQEALDSNGQWKPIEYWQFSDCGNSYGGVILRPNYYLMTKAVKYKGPFETLLRLKLINKDVIIYSKPFKGSINLSQTDTSLLDYKLSPYELFNLDKNDK